MKLLKTLVSLASFALLGVVVLGARRRQPAQSPDVAPDDTTADTAGIHAEITDAVVIPPGIADVDPQPLTQIAGEAIDPDATQAAHDSVRDQRAALPTTNKDLP